MLPATTMIAVYVQKSWIDQIADMAKVLHFRKETDTCVCLIGGNIKLSYPLVEVELVGKAAIDDTKNSKAFIPAYIPASVIIGMFDLTEAEADAYGFHVPTKK